MKTFRKEERLCSKKHLDLLFKNGSSFLLYPLRFTYLQVNDIKQVPAQVVISVSKKRFKRAVDRNLLKRRIKEAYRLEKQALFYQGLSESTSLVLLSIQYIGKDIYNYDLILSKIQKALPKLVKNLRDEPA
ncbi:MAG: ribonuclease P protein component [Pedobacter sp.]|nr:MAG: ribonuclease P protein component [Pedobacter sp.]